VVDYTFLVARVFCVMQSVFNQGQYHNVRCYDYRWFLQKRCAIIDMSVHNQLMLCRVRSLTCHVANLHKLSCLQFRRPCDAAAGPTIFETLNIQTSITLLC
jgi:hypothetical protein